MLDFVPNWEKKREKKNPQTNLYFPMSKPGEVRAVS